jgi:hypothetical protein
MNKLLIVVMVLFFTSCGKKNNQNSENLNSTNEPINNGQEQSIYIEEAGEDKEDEDNLHNANYVNGLGVLVYQGIMDRESSIPDTVKLYNKDSSVYALFSLSKNFLSINGETIELFDIGEKKLVRQYDFQPRVFEPEYEIIHFEVVDQSEKFYEVIINRSSDTKYIEKRSKLFDYLSWNEYLLTSYINFPKNIQKLKSQPSNDSKEIELDKDLIFRPVEVQGDWIKVVCDNGCGECKEKVSGWVKWKKGNILLIELRFVC